MLSLVISCPLLPGFSTKEAPFGCSCRHKKSPNHHQPEHKTYFHFSSHIFVSYCVSYRFALSVTRWWCWDFNDVTLAFEDINLVFDTDDGVWGVDVVVESCKCFFLSIVYLYLLSTYGYLDAEFEELEKGLWPGHGQIMMFILMSRAGLKLM